MTPTITLVHNRVELALHQLRAGDGRPCLHLHGLAERAPEAVPDELSGWAGPVWALDFTGHGASSIPPGGGYYCEILMADVDVALAELGACTVVGRGLGAYIALLIAGARPDLVRGAVLADGPGLAGGGPEPGSPVVVTGPASSVTPDPFALHELARDIRPPDYSASFVRQATQLSDLETVLYVAAQNRPPWLAAVVAEPGVVERTVPDALAELAQV